MSQESKVIKEFIQRNYRHFNAAALTDAAQGWVDHLKAGNKMFFTMAGAMSTAELGISLAEMIRQDKIAAICTTGANLEEDIFNLVAHNDYKRVPEYRSLSLDDEVKLRDEGFNRVTDTCIPETCMRHLEALMIEYWNKAATENQSYFPHEFFFQILKSGKLEKHYQIDPKDSWMKAACDKNLPIFTPGWEDSTLGNMIVANVIKGKIPHHKMVKTGLDQMQKFVGWYKENTANNSLGFFQIGGGIAGDFPICVVPLIIQDLKEDCELWSYFCQISDSTTSYGSYSGATPSEKITWYKLDRDAPKFIIESDASIVAPLVFHYVLAS